LLSASGLVAGDADQEASLFERCQAGSCVRVEVTIVEVLGDAGLLAAEAPLPASMS
jgi:hypothetical protein